MWKASLFGFAGPGFWSLSCCMQWIWLRDSHIPPSPPPPSTISACSSRDSAYFFFPLFIEHRRGGVVLPHRWHMTREEEDGKDGDELILCTSGDRPGKGWRGISQALAGRAAKAWQRLLQENRSVCLAVLRSQGRPLENWSKGVWGCCLLTTSQSEAVSYSDSCA